MDQPRPPVVEFNIGYVLAATAFAGLVVAYILYYILSNTKKTVPTDFVSSNVSQSRRLNVSSTGRNRPSAAYTAVSQEDVSDLDTDNDDQGLLSNSPVDDGKPKKKIGAKKMAKLEAKAEKRAAREAMILEREEKKREQEYLDQLRLEEEEKLRIYEQELEERERLEKEEQAKKDHEAYLELAKSFDIEEEGYDPDDDNGSEQKLAEFIKHIKEQKVVLLEQLASEFKMKTQDVVDRIQKLVSEGQLIGIIDDRGKFISITTEELHSVAKFIKQRGRISVEELVVSSNKLINLKPMSPQC